MVDRARDIEDPDDPSLQNVGRQLPAEGKSSTKGQRSRGRRRGAPAQPPPPPSVPSPFDSPAQWDTLTIGGVLFLGLVLVSGKTGNALDVKKHKGRDGGRISDSGAEAAELTIKFRIWDVATWASWCQVFAVIDPHRTLDRRNPLDVSHPVLAQRRITRIYVKEVTLPERESSGEWSATATVIQWMPSMTAPRAGRSVTRTPEGENASPEGGAQADDAEPDDPAETDTGPDDPEGP